jgi:peroxiredoxin
MALFCFAAQAKVEIGQKAPNFSLKGHDGKTYSLSDLKGNFVVLEWFNNDCPYVDKHYHEDKRNMQTLQAKWIKKGEQNAKKGDKKNKKPGLAWFSIASSAKDMEGHLTAKKAKQIRDEERKAKMTAILLDGDGKVGKAYDAKVTPHMYIIDPDGKLVYNGAIDDKPSARVSTIDGAKNYVSAALSSLFSNKAVAESVTKPYGCSVKYAN